MENVAIHEDWRSRFSELAPGLLLFARQWVRSRADAEDIVQEAFIRFWRRNHAINNRALLYATVRSIALDLIRRTVAGHDVKQKLFLNRSMWWNRSLNWRMKH